ncbi:hypothetical protein PN462_03185 [Spirulina sp. CS-785/01]|uniref:SH3 domain-containing protein n=1 Tax=Spirulina sp. CS-785/01 TaxID=3021716 RepID=UPI00232BDE86|nr:hypothetical protein [Spirulina sp. CS-785/01]MDB9312092.1 hypothetical protein [Spirulina sp. CS-785/01]
MKIHNILGSCSITASVLLATSIPFITPSIEPATAQRTWSWRTCRVSGLQQGRLAVRPEPGGEPFAGLDNGNIVEAMIGTGKFIHHNNILWYYVRVVQGPNSQVNGREGWVNADYLTCE